MSPRTIVRGPIGMQSSGQHAEALTQVLERVPDVRLAVLFGSGATGTLRTGSDLDLGVVMESGASLSSSWHVALERAAGPSVDLIDLDFAPPAAARNRPRWCRARRARTPRLGGLSRAGNDRLVGLGTHRAHAARSHGGAHESRGRPWSGLTLWRRRQAAPEHGRSALLAYCSPTGQSVP